jgi:ATP-binding cassette subfamily C (CFTR/MRP) protein 1
MKENHINLSNTEIQAVTHPRAAGQKNQNPHHHHHNHHHHTHKIYPNLPSLPEKRSNPLSKLTFSWFTEFVYRGQRNRLGREDLYRVPSVHESRQVGSRFISIWSREHAAEDPQRQFGLHRAIFLFARGPILISALLELVKMLASLSSPFLLGLFTISYSNYMGGSDERSTTWLLLVGYCTVICLTQMIASFSGNWAIWILVKSGLDVRTGLMSAIYDRSLNLSGLEKKNYSIARATKMMSSDVLRIEIYWGFLHFFWTCPLQIILAFVFLYGMFGPAVLGGVAVIVVSLPVQAYLIYRMSRQRPKINEVADRRIRLLQEILAGIRVIKLYAWDSIFQDRMATIRLEELREIRSMRYISALITTMTLCLPVLSSVATFYCYIRFVDSNTKLTADMVFPALTFFGRIETPLIIIPIIASYTVDAMEALRRVGKFLRARPSTSIQEVMHSESLAVSLKGEFIWEDATQNPANKATEEAEAETEEVFKFDVEIEKGSLVAIVGSVGSGKTSFLSAINGELKNHSNLSRVQVDGKIGYCPQQAWVRNCSVRENIVFDQPFDEERYRQVIEQCALENDFANFPHGDDTELGEKGISLSGGQKQRISLARMVYFNPDIALLDDPLSAVDAHVGSTLFFDCILEGLLKEKTRILVTNQLHILPYVDHIIVLNEGSVVERGTYQELLSKDTDFSDLLKKYSTEESDEEALTDSDSDTSSSDDEEAMALTASRAKLKAMNNANKNNKTHPHEDVREGVSGKVYWAYASACGGVVFLILASSCMFFTEFSRILRSLTLRDWTNENGIEFTSNAFYYIQIYAGLAALQVLSAFSNTVMFVWGGYRAAKVLHERALARIIRSPMSFFDSTPIGRILTRFSKDLDVVDSYVAEEFNSLIVTFCVIGSSIILIGIINYRILAVIALPVALGYLLQSTFRAISRQLQRLNAQNFSPLMSHFSETFSGLTSIRAFGVQEAFFRKHHELVDVANRAPLMNSAMRRWVGVRSDLMGALLIWVLGLICLWLKVEPVYMGMLLSDTLNVAEYLDWCIKQFAETEMSLMAVERVNHYATKLEVEADEVVPYNRPPPEWPQHGAISIEKLVVSYRPQLPPVLKGISLKISAGEHVAIVGRTGAGKTSIISSLFRLIEPTSGSILIDGIDICGIGLKDLRSRLAIVPQEPALFSGTLRFNLDPHGRYADDEIWLALERTSMREAAMDLLGHLDGEVQECGQNFSIGQRQLLCLTRALLLRSSIIVMDEATANIDLETDEQIQKSLRENFKTSTLITIAHRINTIIDYDRIIVMDAGEVAEVGTPEDLLARDDSIFADLAGEAGITLEDLLQPEEQESSEIYVKKFKI